MLKEAKGDEVRSPDGAGEEAGRDKKVTSRRTVAKHCRGGWYCVDKTPASGGVGLQMVYQTYCVQ